MKLHLSSSAVMIGLCLGFLASPEAQAASFTFTKIADTSDRFSSFGETPALNNAGTVAFFAELDAGGQGIFTGNGATITTIAQTGDRFSRFFEAPSINDAGTVAFIANLDAEGSGLFTSNGTTTTTIATRGINSFGSLGSPSINNAGIVAYECPFLATTIICKGDEEIALRSRGIAVIEPSINDAGTVAYLQQSNGPPINAPFPAAIFTSNGTTTTTITDTSGPFSSLSPSSINNLGTIAFLAELDAGGSGIFTSNGTTTTTITDTSGAFSRFFDTPSINDLGTVAFLAGLDAGGLGIFTGSDPLKDKVIFSGDSLFGSTVQSLGFFREGLNNSGQLAFFASLADGTSGIYRADPLGSGEPPKDVPEPASVLGLLAFGALGATKVMKRKQISSAS